MNRRDFLISLAGLPLLGFLKPEVPKTQPAEFDVAGLYDSGGIPVLPIDNASTLVKWNGAGDSWESIDGGETWEQTGFRELAVSGEFVYGDILVVWDGHTWKEIDNSLT